MEIFTYPPITFAFILILILLIAKFLKTFEPKTLHNTEKTKTYACGEDFPSQKITPSYEEFYPYAIFFTILHVAALMIMTIAFSTEISFIVPMIYSIIIGITLSLIFIIR
ncbi:MAG: NADH-quinone oxidoreductase subunit A [Clostridia bacterium]|nr:NADH-quinone oxidoreductase subunit A [Clostridia bacterium]